MILYMVCRFHHTPEALQSEAYLTISSFIVPLVLSSWGDGVARGKSILKRRSFESRAAFQRGMKRFWELVFAK